MKLNSDVVLKVLKVLTWAGFLGLCVKAGSLLFSYSVSMFFNPIGAKNLYMGLDLSQLKEQSSSEYSILFFFIFLIIALQVLMFFVLLQIFKHINLVSPFDEKIRKLILNLSMLTFGIGLLSKLTVGFSSRFISQGMSFPHLFEHIDIGDSFVFFAGILFFISVIFKRELNYKMKTN
ncbi:MAG: hypothetical protein IPO92_19660 [Saprospiraceae bacterium]|nr:hypothetical protein [Saprospiraceae bacterium]